MLENLRPDPTFYPSPRLAMEAEPEHIAYTVLLSPDRSRPDALAVIDVDPRSENPRQGAEPARHAQSRRRVPPLRLERLQLGACRRCPATRSCSVAT